LLGLLDVLTYLPTDHGAAALLRESALRLGRALIATQHSSGHWPGLVQEQAAFLETSAAFFFAAGLTRGVRMRLFPPEWSAAARRAFDAGLAAVEEDGTIRGVSAAVWACTSLAHYRAVPVGFQVPWGQGPFLVAAACMGADLEPCQGSPSR
jgi:unsaturated rhamnogalacturonyl hydrolase